MLRILLVDDNPDDRALAVRELNREFSALKVNAIAQEQEFTKALTLGDFDLAVVDYQLLWTNGLVLLQAIKSRYPDRPVIMFTNTGSQEIAVEAMKAGLDDYIVKSPKHYIRLAASVRSVLERAEERRQIARLEIRLRSLLDRLNVGVFRASLSGQLLEGNAAFLSLLGFEANVDLSTVNLCDLYDDPTICRQFLAQMNEQEVMQDHEVQLCRQDGRRIWVLLSGMLSRQEGERFIDGLIDDISDRKQAEAEVQQLNATLERRVIERTTQLAEANADLEAFAYTVSHDLRAPLRAMQWLAYALLEDNANQLSASSQNYARRIITAAQQANTLIQDLLAYSRLSQSELQLEPIDLTLAVTEAIAQLEADLQEKQAEMTVESPLPTVMAQRVGLVQAIANLLSNALKFVEPQVRPQIRVWAETQNNSVRLWVQDNGIGISPEYQERIFQVFERLHGSDTYAGTGVGLAIVRKSIERMGGKVGVESDAGQGSRFWIELAKQEQVHESDCE